jgi:tRNA dimethylallyltransferase
VVFIVGPTGTGKSDAAVALAPRVGGEIVSGDSMQFYRGMDVGTAKPGPEDRARVPHHMLDIVEPDEAYNVADYHRDATRVIEDIVGRGALPLVVGGSGLYIRSIASRLDLPVAEPDNALREELRAIARRDGPAVLHARLAEVDPESASRIHPNDVKKVIRAIEVHAHSGRPLSEAYSSAPPPTDRWECLMFGLTCEREELYRRLEERCVRMVHSGLVEEVKRLLARGYGPDLQSMQAIGYKEFAAYHGGELPFPEALAAFQRNTRRYAKRQLTWFRSEPRIRWLDITEGAPVEAMAAAVTELRPSPE